MPASSRSTRPSSRTRGVELGEPSLEPVGLIAVAHPLNHTAGGVDAGLAGLHRRRAPLLAAASAASCTSVAVAELVDGFGRCRLQFRRSRRRARRCRRATVDAR